MLGDMLRAAFAGLVLIWLTLCVQVDGAEPPPKATDTLSVEETVALTTVRMEEGVPWQFYKSANPAARAALLEIVKDPNRAEQHAGAWRILGYIGTPEDVQLFRDASLHNYHGVLDGPNGRAVPALLDGLGLMGRRGIGQAEALLKEMGHQEYWQAVDFQWHTDQKLAADAMTRRHDRTLRSVLRGLALAEKEEEVGKLVKAILDEVDDPERRDYLQGLLDPDNLLNYAARMREQEAEPVSQALMNAVLAEAMGRPLGTVIPAARVTETPRTPLGKEDSAFVQAIAEEARVAFERITSRILEGEYEVAIPQLLDNGEPLELEKARAIWAEFQRDVGKTSALLQELKKRHTAWSECVVVRSSTWECAAIEETPLRGARSDVIVLKATLTNTTDLGKRIGRSGRTGRVVTVAEDGSLIIVLKKLDDQWYWNPFAW